MAPKMTDPPAAEKIKYNRSRVFPQGAAKDTPARIA
jgi:hypothetical protein